MSAWSFRTTHSSRTCRSPRTLASVWRCERSGEPRPRNESAKPWLRCTSRPRPVRGWTSSPEDNSSGSRWPGLWSTVPSYSCLMSQCRTSMPGSVWTPGLPCGTCTRRRHHLDLCDARPGRGARYVYPGGRDEYSRTASGRHPGRGLRATKHEVRGDLPRSEQHLRFFDFFICHT